MKIVIVSLVLLFSFNLFSQDSTSTHVECDDNLGTESPIFALDGGKYKPSSNSPGEYLRALVVFVQFSIDNHSISDWPLDDIPDWADDVFDSQTASSYTSGTVSDYFDKMSGGDFVETKKMILMK